MESTGTYWQHLYITLQAAGFKVILCNGKFTKNIKGRKTDVMDAQWIQKLHTIPTVPNCYLPSCDFNPSCRRHSVIVKNLDLIVKIELSFLSKSQIIRGYPSGIIYIQLSRPVFVLSLIHISEPTRRTPISYAV